MPNSHYLILSHFHTTEKLHWTIDFEHELLSLYGISELLRLRLLVLRDKFAFPWIEAPSFRGREYLIT